MCEPTSVTPPSVGDDADEKLGQVLKDYLRLFYYENTKVVFSPPWGGWPDLTPDKMNCIRLLKVLDFKTWTDNAEVAKMIYFNHLPFKCIEASMYDLFLPLHGQVPVITLIEGDSFDQRALCWKLLHDWSISVLDQHQTLYVYQFSLVIYVDCKQMSSLSLFETLSSLVQPLFEPLMQSRPEISIRGVCKWLVSHQKEVLVILDSFDFLGELNVDSILHTLCLSESTLLICSRPGYVDHSACKSVLINDGLSATSGMELLKNIMSSRCCLDELRPILRKIEGDFMLVKILKSIHLIYLLAWYLIEKGFKPKTHCIFSLYKELTNLAFRHYMKKFSLELDNKQMEQMLIRFSRLACQAWQNNRFYFSHEDMDPEILQLPNMYFMYFMEEIPLPLQNFSSYYMFSSTYYLEYFVALYIAKCTETKEKSRMLDIIVSSESPFLCSVLTGCLKAHYDDAAVCELFQKLAKVGNEKCVNLGIFDKILRGSLRDYGLCLECLSQVYFQPGCIQIVVKHFPDIMEYFFQKCPERIIENFYRLTRLNELNIQGMILHLDGMEENGMACISLAGAVNHISNLTTLMVHCEYVYNSHLLVDVVTEVFKHNSRIKTLTLSGEMNKAGNILPVMYSKVKSIFTKDIALRTLSLDNLHNKHRVAYILNIFPHIFERLELRRCNLESCGQNIMEKIQAAEEFTSLTLDHSSVRPEVICQIVDKVIIRRTLKRLNLSLLSPMRNFISVDSKSTSFRQAVDTRVCEKIKELVQASPSLSDVILCHNHLDDSQLAVVMEAVLQTRHIMQLDLTGNMLTDTSIDVVTRLIQECTNLKTLLLSGNNFSHEGKKQIIKLSVYFWQLKLVM